MKYFAYGSNMDHKQMGVRCPGNKFHGPAKISGYKFVFDGDSRMRNGAVANIVEFPGGMVWGGLFEVSDANLAALDRYEGFPSSYQREELNVCQEADEVTKAIVYFRTNKKPGQPSQEYKEVVLRGAKDCGLPEEYINQIKSL
jgi:gamma-glutamylcyclotransferase